MLSTACEELCLIGHRCMSTHFNVDLVIRNPSIGEPRHALYRGGYRFLESEAMYNLAGGFDSILSVPSAELNLLGD